MYLIIHAGEQGTVLVLTVISLPLTIYRVMLALERAFEAIGKVWQSFHRIKYKM